MPTYRAEWRTIRQPLASLSRSAVTVHSRSAFVLRHSHDGNLAALGVNQPNTHANSVLFISPASQTLVVSRLKGCGAKTPMSNRYTR